MEETIKNPLGTEKVKKLILKFSIPSIASFLINSIYNIVDQVYIGHGIGTTGIAATNVSFPFFTIFSSIALMLAIGSASNLNLHLGRGDRDKAEKTVGNGILMMLICGIVLGVICFAFAQPLLVAFGTSKEVMELALPYSKIVLLGMPFQVISMGLTQIIRADGKPNYSMICMISGSLFNIIFDPIFMYTLGWGIKGIAWATTLGQVLSSGLAAIYVFRGFKSIKLTRSSFKLELSYVKAICSLGLGSCLNQLAMTIIQIVMNNTLTHYGELSHYGSVIPQAAVGAISKVSTICLSFSIGIAQGCQPVNGFNYGAKQFDRVKETLKTAVISVLAISTVVFAVFQLFPTAIISIFGQGSAEYYEFATRYLRIFMFMTFSNGLQPVVANYYTATGRAKVGIFMSMTRQLIFLLPLLIILPMIWGIDGVVFAGPIADFVTACLATFFIVREFRRLNKMIAETPKSALPGTTMEGA